MLFAEIRLNFLVLFLVFIALLLLPSGLDWSRRSWNKSCCMCSYLPRDYFVDKTALDAELKVMI